MTAMPDPAVAQSLTIQCKCKSGNWIELNVLDISLAGCMVDRRAWSVREGERVLAKLPGLAHQAAEVVWIEGDRAGIAFEELLYEPVLEHLRLSIA